MMTGCFGRSPFTKKNKSKKKKNQTKDNDETGGINEAPSKQEKIELLTSSQNSHSHDPYSPHKDEHSFNRSTEGKIEVEQSLLHDNHQEVDTSGEQFNSTSFSFLEDSSLCGKEVRSLDTTTSEPVQKFDKSTSFTLLIIDEDDKILTSFVDIGCQFDQLPIATQHESDQTLRDNTIDKPSYCDFECQFDQEAILDVDENIHSKPSKEGNEMVTSVDFGCQAKDVNNNDNVDHPKMKEAPVTVATIEALSSESPSPPTPAERRRAALLSIVKKTKAPKFHVEDVVGEEGELLNAAAVRKLLQKPTVKSYTYFMICLKKGSTKFVEQILQECDALQLMFDALAALSMKSIGSFTDTILQLEIVRALKMILNSSVGIVYLIDEDRGFVSDLAYGKMLFFFP